MNEPIPNSDPAPEIAVLIQMLDDAYEKEAWHGPALYGSIRRVPGAEAAWRPGDKQRSIREIVVHCAYWKYAVWRRLCGEKKGGFPYKGSNWFVRPDPKLNVSWREDVAVLDEMHRKLRAAVADLDPADLPTAPEGSRVTNAAIVSGIALHDVYHAGQIQQLRSLYSQARRVAGPDAE